MARTPDGIIPSAMRGTAGDSGTRGEVPLPPCTSCGRCCFASGGGYIRVFEVDWERMGEAARAATEPWEGGRAMRMREGRCASLAIDRRAGTLSCSIYDERPDACRALARGSSGCLADAESKRDRALAVLRS
jgi:hypothetical protein